MLLWNLEDVGNLHGSGERRRESCSLQTLPHLDTTRRCSACWGTSCRWHNSSPWKSLHIFYRKVIKLTLYKDSIWKSDNTEVKEIDHCSQILNGSRSQGNVWAEWPSPSLWMGPRWGKECVILLTQALLGSPRPSSKMSFSVAVSLPNSVFFLPNFGS